MADHAVFLFILKASCLHLVHWLSADIDFEDWYCSTRSDLAAAANPLAAPPVSTVCHLCAPTEAPLCLKTKEHNVLQRQRVVDLWKDGRSEGSIGQELHMPKSTVHSIIVKYRLSNTVENLPRNGRPKKSWLIDAMDKNTHSEGERMKREKQMRVEREKYKSEES